MGVFISKREYSTETRNTKSEFLGACIGERIKVFTDIYFCQVYIATPDNQIFWVPDPSRSGRIYNDDLILFEDGNFLNSCQVGDLLLSDGIDGNAPGPYTLLEIINGGLGRLAEPISAEVDGSLPGRYIAVDTPLKSLLYQYGIGTGGFESLVDGSLQKFIVNSSGSLDSVTITLENVGDKDWQFDTLVSEGDGSGPDVTQQRLKIVHETVVGPLFLAGQYDDLFNGVAPDYFKPDNTIRYRAQIDYQKNAYNVNEANTLVLPEVGQFGWFNTKFNGSASDYSIISLQFKRADLSTANQLEYDPIEVKFRITSATSNFDAADTVLVFGFNYLPSDESFYQNTGRDIETNFAFDSKRFFPNNTPVNGNKFGTGTQIIKNIKGQVISTSVLEVTVNIEIGADQLPILKQGDIAQYAIWCIVEDTSLDTELTDKSNLLVDVNYIYVQKTKIDLLDSNTLFIEHPYDTLQYAEETLTMFPVDDVVANNLITLDYTGLENDGILLKSATPSIVLKHADEADIVLDSFFISLTNYPLIGSSPAVQDIKFQSNRPYKIEDGIRKTITMYRNIALDSGNTRAWLLSFPFMHRWEYWKQIVGLNNIPLDLYDNTVPFGGANHLWNRIVNASDWTLVYRTTFEIEQNGEDFEQVFEQELTSTGFNSNTDWSDCEITSHDIDTDDQIIVGPKQYVYSQKNTLIRAKFTKSSGIVPDLDGVYMVIWAEGFEGGGISEIRNIDSGRDVIPLSCFTGVNGTKRVSISKNISTFTGEAILDFSKIPSGQKITVYARIYEYSSGNPEDGRVTNDDILRMTLDGQIRLVN